MASLTVIAMMRTPLRNSTATPRSFMKLAWRSL
jgi:hypothetical protein